MHGLRTWEWTCETWLYLATESGWRERPVGPRQKMPDDMSGTLNRHVNLVTVGWYILAIVQLKRSTTVWWLNKRSQSFPSATVQTYHLRFGKHLCFCRSEVESSLGTPRGHAHFTIPSPQTHAEDQASHSSVPPGSSCCLLVLTVPE